MNYLVTGAPPLAQRLGAPAWIYRQGTKNLLRFSELLPVPRGRFFILAMCYFLLASAGTYGSVAHPSYIGKTMVPAFSKKSSHLYVVGEAEIAVSQLLNFYKLHMSQTFASLHKYISLGVCETPEAA